MNARFVRPIRDEDGNIVALVPLDPDAEAKAKERIAEWFGRNQHLGERVFRDEDGNVVAAVPGRPVEKES